MNELREKRIAYLFGAGATHAEMIVLEEELGSDENLQKELGLLTSHVSQRVFKVAQTQSDFYDPFIKDIITTPEGAKNIELFISLLEGNGQIIPNAAKRADILRDLVEKDITNILNFPARDKMEGNRIDRFLLHKALLEMHQHQKVLTKEKIIGIISLNYDTVLDQAYKTVFGIDPEYGLTFNSNPDLQLLKLHGSFDWDEIEILGKRRSIPIIPLGTHKNYLRLPYNYIWGHALELLVGCDILRIIGCSMSANDTHLIDLLFQAHIMKGLPFRIEIINTQRTSVSIESTYGFLPNIVGFEKIEENLISNPTTREPFKDWLIAKGSKMLSQEDLEKTKWLKELIL